jgi:hypothetical protein
MDDSNGVTESAKRWLKFTEQLGDAGLRIHQMFDGPRTEQQHGEINQGMIWAVSTGALLLMQMDPDHPDWYPLINSANRIENPNHDNVYYITRIRGSGTYRIGGFRGTAWRVDFNLNQGFIGFPGVGPVIANLNLDDFAIAEDGSFELVLGPSRPEGYTGNWHRLDPDIDDTFIMLRQIAYDWPNEEDGRFTIQRIDRPIVQQHPITSAEIDERIGQLPVYLFESINYLMNLNGEQWDKLIVNEVENCTESFGNSMTVASQQYYVGKIRVAPDEALVLEIAVTVNDESYWSVSLMDSFYKALDPMYHQSGLNGHSARIDPDGKYRFVVARTDPGVPNWLDKGNYDENAVRFRLYKCGDPPITTKLVKLADVRQHLHPETPEVTPEQRQAILRRRVENVQLRRRW